MNWTTSAIVGAALLTVMSAGAGTLALAQDAPGQPGMRRPGGPGGPGPRGMMGEFGLPLGALNLSDEQKTQVKAVIDGHRAELQQQAERIGPAHQALRQAIATIPVDEALIRAKAAELAAVEADGAVLNARIRSEIFALLTPEQAAAASQPRNRPRRGAPR